MEMTWIWILLLVITVPMLFLYFIKIRKPKEDILEPSFIHIFPDYPRGYPYEAVSGETLKFMVKGYADQECLEEIELIKSDIVWKHQNYIGEIIEEKAGSIIYMLPTAEDKKGKTSYIAVNYHKLKDTTWMKIAV